MFTSAAQFYTTVGALSRPEQGTSELGSGNSGAGGQASATPQPSQRTIRNTLNQWRDVYQSTQTLIANRLNTDPLLVQQLRTAYLQALEALHRSAPSTQPRVTINLIAAPGDHETGFLEFAAAYARSYFSPNDQTEIVVQTFENIQTIAELFDAIESTRPELRIGTINIFSHGTIGLKEKKQPSNVIFFGNNQYRLEDIQQASNSRLASSAYLQSIARFDEHSRIALHGCRLGGGQGQEYLQGVGAALGGQHAQETSGYDQRFHIQQTQVHWRPPGGKRKDEIPARNTEADIYGPNSLPIRSGHPRAYQPFINRFEQQAIRLFDRVINGSMEVQKYLSPAEQQSGQITRERKLEIMRAMYDENEGWLLGFLHPSQEPGYPNPATSVKSKRFTFTRETADWERHEIEVRVPSNRRSE